MKYEYAGIKYDIDERYSFKDFTGRNLKKEDIPNNVVIYGSCFSQEIVDRNIFRDDMTGVTFIKCNLDNCFIPVGNVVVDCWQRKFSCQNDGNDWILDKDSKPLKPVNHKIFTKLSLPMPDPKDIPVVKCEECIDLLKAAKTKQLSFEVM